MWYVVSKSIDSQGIFYLIIYNEKVRQLVDEVNFKSLSNKICPYFEDKLTLIVNKVYKRQSYTLLGKYFKGKNREVYYVYSDWNGTLNHISRRQLLLQNIQFSNAIVSDNMIRFKSGSIPFLGHDNRETRKFTVEKLGEIEYNTIGFKGVNKKFKGRRLSDGKFGIVKFPLVQESYDCINEVVCYELGKLFGFDVAEASLEYYLGKECIISCYKDNSIVYNSVKSLKSIIGTNDFHKNFQPSWIIKNYGRKSLVKFIQMLLFDFITRQEDRHISNIAFYNNELYSLYDNGRSLFYDSYKDILLNLNMDMDNFTALFNTFCQNEHGFTYIYLTDVVTKNEYKNYINLNVTYNNIYNIFKKYYEDEKRARLTALYVYKVYKWFIM